MLVICIFLFEERVRVKHIYLYYIYSPFTSRKKTMHTFFFPCEMLSFTSSILQKIFDLIRTISDYSNHRYSGQDFNTYRRVLCTIESSNLSPTVCFRDSFLENNPIVLKFCIMTHLVSISVVFEDELSQLHDY